MKDLISLFTKLAQIDSISGEEEQIAKYVERYLETLGLIPVRDSQNNIYCAIGDVTQSKLFCAHLDTVEPGRNINVAQKDGYLVSVADTILGGDNKISLAAILYSVKKLLQQKKKIHIELLFTVREETDSGIQNIKKEMLQSPVAFIFDGGNGSLGHVIQQAPTIQDFVFIIKGKAAHGAKPEKGNSVLQVLRNLPDSFTLGRLDEFSTFNIGLIEGGTATNTVPELLVMKGDLRSTDHTLFLEHKKRIVNELKKAAKKSHLTFHAEWIPYSYGYTLNLDSPYYQSMKALYNSLDISMRPVSSTSGSDASYLNHIGIEAYCLGDGVENGHTVSERIKIETFVKLQQVVEKLMLLKFEN